MLPVPVFAVFILRHDDLRLVAAQNRNVVGRQRVDGKLLSPPVLLLGQQVRESREQRVVS
ncbi:hypothetical protein SDC9_185317 [bioreactor metagenome]|uniref:Uncharacterized protein n=1 Tax=bioreactor metagenome TaxID=1076179 RepID=A0A645HGU8_9ZZZZ